MSGITLPTALLAQHLREMADRLERADLPPAADRVGGERPVSSWPEASSAATALYLDRRQRGRFFDDILFGEGAWDILLTLFAAAAENRTLSLAECCAGAHLPESTALRYVSVLEQSGNVRRSFDRLGGRGVLISLTENGFAAMYAYLTAITAGPR